MLTQEEIRKAVKAVAQRYSIQQIYLFGSYARGDAVETSDCDFRIVGGNIRNLYDIAEIMLDLEEALGKKIDIVLTKNIIDKEFFDNIREDEVLVYG